MARRGHFGTRDISRRIVPPPASPTRNAGLVSPPPPPSIPMGSIDEWANKLNVWASGWVNKERKNEKREKERERKEERIAGFPFHGITGIFFSSRSSSILSPLFLFPIISPSHESAKLSSKRADAIFYGYLSNATPRPIFGGPRANNEPGTFLITVFDIWSRFVFRTIVSRWYSRKISAIELRIIELRIDEFFSFKDRSKWWK